MLFSVYHRFVTSLVCLVPIALVVCTPPSPHIAPIPRSALLIVDMQNCFSPTGSLAVPSFLSVLPTINRLHSLPLFSLVALSQDYHPPNHISFAATWPDALPFTSRELHYDTDRQLCNQPALPALSHHCPSGTPTTAINQTLWPTHCVMGTDGAAFHPSLLHLPTDVVVRKGQSAAIDSYSAFADVLASPASHPTQLPATLRRHHIDRLYVVGVALEVCVYASVMDAVAEGLEVVVVEDGVAGINPKAIEEKRRDMAEAGVTFLHSWEVPGWTDVQVEAVLERTMEVEVAIQ